MLPILLLIIVSVVIIIIIIIAVAVAAKAAAVTRLRVQVVQDKYDGAACERGQQRIRQDGRVDLQQAGRKVGK